MVTVCVTSRWPSNKSGPRNISGHSWLWGSSSNRLWARRAHDHFSHIAKVWEREILQLPVILQIFGLRDQETSVSTRAPARCIGSKLCWIWMNMNSISMNDSWTGFWNLGMHDIPRNWGHRKFWRYLFFPGSSKSETQLYCNLVTSAVVSSFSWVVIQNRFRADITHSLESIATKSSKVRSLTHWSSSLRKAMM